MKTLQPTLIVLVIAALTGGAAVPDVVPEGTRIMSKDMRVDPGEFAKTHFVFVTQSGQLIEPTLENTIRCYMFETRVHVAPRKQRAAILAAFAAVPPVTKRSREAYKEHANLRQARADRIEKVLAAIPRSAPLENREGVSIDHPVHKIDVRYVVAGVDGKEVLLKHTRTLYGKKGKVLTPKQVEKAQQSYASLLLFVAAIGVIGLGFVLSRRKAGLANA